MIKSLQKTISKLESLNPKTEVMGYVDMGGYCDSSMMMDLELKVKKMRKGDECVEVVIDIALSD